MKNLTVGSVPKSGRYLIKGVARNVEFRPAPYFHFPIFLGDDNVPQNVPVCRYDVFIDGSYMHTVTVK